MSSGSNFMKPEPDELGEGERSIDGFGFASQTGFDSEAAVASTANSSGEQETSFTSPPFEATSGRDWANADNDRIERANVATKTRGNSLYNSIDRERPSPKQFLFFGISV
jgi:hypothetical protein